MLYLLINIKKFISLWVIFKCLMCKSKLTVLYWVIFTSLYFHHKTKIWFYILYIMYIFLLLPQPDEYRWQFSSRYKSTDLICQFKTLLKFFNSREICSHLGVFHIYRLRKQFVDKINKDINSIIINLIKTISSNHSKHTLIINEKSVV